MHRVGGNAMVEYVWRGLIAAQALLTAVGCGANSTPEGEDDSAGTDRAAAGLTVNLTEPIANELPSATDRSCSAGSTGASYAIGAPRPRGTMPSGIQGVGVRCTVTGRGVIDAAVSGPETTSLQPISFDVESTVIDVFAPTPAEITFYSRDTLELGVLDGFPECTLDYFDVLKAGAVLAGFTCPLLGSADDASAGCRAEGTLAFEYCKTE